MTPTQTSSHAPSTTGVTIFICIAIIAIRLVTLPFPDLIDSTEGRYAAAAVTMIEKGDFLTPYIDMGKGSEPYLGKPPMHFWLTVGCFKLFGVSEMSARLPSFLATLLSAVMLFLFTAKIWGRSAGSVAILAYLSSGLTFFLAGAALLDTTLMLFTTAAILLFGGYYLCDFNKRPKLTSFLVGAALSGAFLTKGPVSIAIFLAAVIPWALIHREAVLKKRFPLLVCIASFIVFTAPWYLACEYYHPGFLYYFIVKENLLRIVSDNYGDRYGSGHPQIFGTSILFLLCCLMPWTIVCSKAIAASVRRTELKNCWSLTYLRSIESPLLFATTWTLSMPAFLLLTSQYTANYLSPIMPGGALLLSGLLVRASSSSALCLPDWMMKALKGIIAIAMVVLPIVGFSLGAPWWIVIPCTLAAILVITLLYTSLRTGNFEWQVGRISLITVALYSSVIFSLFSYISSRRSTAEVITLIRRDVVQGGDSTTKVGFKGVPPFSSVVYGGASAPRIILEGVSVIGEDNKKFAYYITAVKKPDPPPASILELGRTRRWIVYKTKEGAQPPSEE